MKTKKEINEKLEEIEYGIEVYREYDYRIEEREKLIRLEAQRELLEWIRAVK